MISVLIPSRNEQFLVQTVKSLFEKATGDIEVIVVLDGYWPDPPLLSDKRLTLIHFGKARGMRPAINAAAEAARGEFVMKLDAHCAVAPGFDKALAENCEDDWVVVPRRYSLDADTWAPRRGRRPIDYLYLSYPSDPNDRGGPGLHGRTWDEKNRDEALKEKRIDDLMSAQGSCYFMHRDYFHELELLDEDNYGPFANEFQEVGFKTWLSGGRVVRNKNTWYAHLHKGKKYGRGYPLGKSDVAKAAAKTNTWLHDESGWEKQTKPFSWMIKHFWPVPGWPEDEATWKVAEK